MKIDFYTKAVLTVIAVCLVTIALRDLPLVGEAQAQMRPGQGPVYEADGSLRVKISNAPLQVSVQ